MKLKQRIVIIVQARMTSQRLPGKLLLPAVGKPLLSLLFERLKRVQHADDIVLATTTNAQDDALIHIAVEHEIAFFRGDEDDVLSRYAEATNMHHADVIVRITADCPLIDPEVIDKVITAYLTHTVDYASNTLKRTYPRGMDVEVFSKDILEICNKKAVESYQREHVTPYIYNNHDKFKLFNVTNDIKEDRWRICVDTKEDYLLVRKIFENLYVKNERFSLNDILKLLHEHSDWGAINANVVQKDAFKSHNS